MTTFQVSHPVNWIVEGADTTLPSVLKWSSEDPVAVHVSFGQEGEKEPVDWAFARELLADVVSGKHDATGEGDVTVARHDVNQLILTLTTGHTVRLRTSLEEIRIFLQSTFIYAPLGEEAVDMDSMIDKLLNGEWGIGV